MVMDANFEVEANPRIRRLRELIELQVKDLKQMADMVDRRFVKNMKRQFATEGQSGGAKWADLSPKYAARKKRLRPGRKIMAFDGKLRRSLTNRNHGRHRLSFGMKPSPYIEFGTYDQKAAWHGPAEGNPWKNPMMPERDVMQHTDTQDRGYFDIIRNYFATVKTPRYMRALRAWRGVKRKRGTA